MKAVHAHASSANALRKSKIANTPKYPAGIITLQVLGTGAIGAPASLYVFTDQTRYLFNCGEGSQRLAHEHKMKLAKLEHIFITRNTWEMMGGLPGLALTAEVVGVPSITLHGPPNLDKLFESTSRFCITNNLKVTYANCVDNSYFEDHVLKVEYIPVCPPSVNTIDLSLPEDDVHDQISLDGSKRHLKVTSEEDLKRPRGISSRSQDSMCYICRPKEKEGGLLIEECRKRGVPFGPLLGKLKAGQDVELPNGNIVLAADVKSPCCPGPIFIIADCPTEHHIDALVTNSVWAKYQKQNLEEGDENSIPNIVVHFAPEKFLLDPRYISWIESFPSTTQHLLINDSCQSLGSEAIHRAQYKLNMIDDKVFPLLHSDGERIVESNNSPKCDVDDDNDSKTNKVDSESFERVIPPQLAQIKASIVLAESVLQYSIRPSLGFNYSTVIRLSPQEYREEVLVTENFTQCYENLKESLNHLENSTDHQEFPNILFAGTGSCLPNKGRNVSGMLLQMTHDTRMVLDCGEGTYSQFLRFYGPHKILKVLMEIKSIYISHLHADHHLGLVSLLVRRREAFKQLNIPFVPVVLIVSHNLQPFLTSYHDTFELIHETYQLVSSISLRQNYEGPHPMKNKKEFFDALGFKNIETVPVEHAANAHGVTLEHKDGWKITYSGDTMPCAALVTLGKDSDVCIHEATLEDELTLDAKAKQHSTTSQAIEIGQKMNAKFILLTHFSQRYAKVPKINGELAPNVGITFDNMLVRLIDLPKLPLMYPVFKCIYSEYFEDMVQKTLKRKWKDEKENATCSISLNTSTACKRADVMTN